MSLEAVLRWDSNLLLVPAIILIAGLVLALTAFVMSREKNMLRWGLMAPAAALVAFNYYLAYRSISDIMTKFAQLDMIHPLYGLAVLMMFPFTINFLRLVWTGASKIVTTRLPTVDEVVANRILERLKECERIGIITPEAYEICKIHLSTTEQQNV